MPVRLKDIADDLNLSKMTISRVLRGQTDVSAETKARVLQRVKELRYRPNAMARSLRTGQTSTLGLIVPSLRETYFSELARGVDQMVRSEGYGLAVCLTDGDAELEQRQIELLLARQVDALLVVSVQETTTFFEGLAIGESVPLVFVNRKVPGSTRSFVGLYEERVGRTAAEHLISVGCRRLAYLRGPRTPAGDLRYNGFREALHEAELPYHADLVIDGMGAEAAEYKRGFDGMRRLLSSRIRPDGLMAYTDMMAVGAMDAALSRGIRIPEGIAFVGSGNETRLCEMRIALSSVDAAGDEVGRKAGRLALQLISDTSKAGSRRILVSPKLVQRSSSLRQYGKVAPAKRPSGVSG
jgi:LacI family transcriptional regulator